MTLHPWVGTIDLVEALPLGGALIPRILAPIIGFLAIAPSRADIVYVDIPDTNVVVSPTIVLIDFDNNGPGPQVLTLPFNAQVDIAHDLVVGQYAAAFIANFEHVEFTLLTGQTLANASTGIVKRLASGTVIGPSSAPWFSGNSWLEYQGNGAGAWNDWSGEAFIGFRFDPNYTFNRYHYGWFRVYYDDPSDLLTLLDFAYEGSTDTAILANAGGTAAVPETGSGLLVGCTGVAALVGQIVWRRRRSCPA